MGKEFDRALPRITSGMLMLMIRRDWAHCCMYHVSRIICWYCVS